MRLRTGFEASAVRMLRAVAREMGIKVLRKVRRATDCTMCRSEKGGVDCANCLVAGYMNAADEEAMRREEAGELHNARERADEREGFGDALRRALGQELEDYEEAWYEERMAG